MRFRSVRSCTTSRRIPCLFALSTLITVAFLHASLSMSTLGGFILLINFSYSSSISNEGLQSASIASPRFPLWHTRCLSLSLSLSFSLSFSSAENQIIPKTVKESKSRHNDPKPATHNVRKQTSRLSLDIK
eukprot:TRINITY_DN35093_c2_g1_i1.p1 TRINITY_DN35093_c2_g1~~TRINITY_DN35093_c2_g1_i1.p1  ORF type:complete len:131 (+),score=14.07 TRINITY_DN35093_c2_g1_i1:248-640(+)